MTIVKEWQEWPSEDVYAVAFIDKFEIFRDFRCYRLTRTKMYLNILDCPLIVPVAVL